VSRSIYFPVFIFLCLFALLLLLSEQFSRFSAPRSMLESGKAIAERMFGYTAEEATRFATRFA
jgi:hypothetical protein